MKRRPNRLKWLMWFIFASLLPLSLLWMKGLPQWGQESSPTTPTVAAEPLSQRLPIQVWYTQNQIPVYFVPIQTLPIVDVILLFDAGSARDGEQAGLASLTASLLPEGTQQRSGDQIAERLAHMGAKLEAIVTTDKSGLHLRVLNDAPYLEEASLLLAQIAAEPAFEGSVVERVKQQRLARLQAQLVQPDYVALSHFYQGLYPHHPYGHLQLGTPESLGGITPAALRDFHQRYYVAQNAALTIVGHISQADARALAESILGSLAKGQAADPVPDVPRLNQAQMQRIPFKSQQAHILIGQPCRYMAAEPDPDMFPLLVGNYILGKSDLKGRLFDTIREQNGLAYAVYSETLAWRKPAPFLINLQTKADQAGRAIQLTRQVLETFVAQGPTAEEVVAAKKHLVGAFALGLATNSDVARTVADMAFYRLPPAFLENYQNKLSAVTPEQIKETFKRRLNLNEMLTVQVGG